MKLGLVMTIRNERAQLRSNLLYHRFVGVDQVYLFHDRCADGSLDTVSDLDFVRIGATVDPDLLRGRPGTAPYIEQYHQITARQALNVICALDLAVDDGIDWLMHIDADELVCPDPEQVDSGGLNRFIQNFAQTQDVECVRFPPFEVCPRRMEYDNVFAEETLFTPPDAKGKRRLFDPINHAYFLADYTLGHRKGKSAVRVANDVVPRGSHEFQRLDGTQLSTVSCGLLLHYYLHSFSQFVNKFRNMVDRPDTWMHGKPIRPQKRLWRDMVNGGQFSEDELRRYFQEWIRVDESEADRRQRGRRICGVPVRQPTLMEIKAAARAFDLIAVPQPAEQKTLMTGA